MTWASATASVATISNASGTQGLATAVAAGSSAISATLGSVLGSTVLTVSAVTLQSIAVTPANPTLTAGTTRQFTATGTYSDSSTQNLTSQVTWASANTSVATISNASGSQGLATAVATGSSSISATLGGVTGSTVLTVSAAVLLSIAVTPVNPSIAVGQTVQFTATGTYSDNTTQNLTTKVVWTSDMNTIAAVSNSPGTQGLTRGVSIGTTTIKAKMASISGTTGITVTAFAPSTLALTGPSLAPGGNSAASAVAMGTLPLQSTEGSTQTGATALPAGKIQAQVKGANLIKTTAASLPIDVQFKKGLAIGNALGQSDSSTTLSLNDRKLFTSNARQSETQESTIDSLARDRVSSAVRP